MFLYFYFTFCIIFFLKKSTISLMKLFPNRLKTRRMFLCDDCYIYKSFFFLMKVKFIRYHLTYTGVVFRKVWTFRWWYKQKTFFLCCFLYEMSTKIVKQSLTLRLGQQMLFTLQSSTAAHKACRRNCILIKGKG